MISFCPHCSPATSTWYSGRWRACSPPPPEIAEEELFQDRFAIAWARITPCASRRAVTADRVARFPLDFACYPGNSYRRHIEALFMTEGVPWPDNCVLTSSLVLVESLLAQSDRVTMITELQATMQNNWRIRSIPLKGGGQRTIGFKWRRSGNLSRARDSIRGVRPPDCAHGNAAEQTVQAHPDWCARGEPRCGNKSSL